MPLVRHTQCGRRYQVRPLRRRPDGRRGARQRRSAGRVRRHGQARRQVPLLRHDEPCHCIEVLEMWWRTPDAPPAPTPQAAAKPKSGIGLIPIIVIGLVIVACAAIFTLSVRTSDAVGTVQSLSWQRSITILEQRPVQHENWRDQVPSGAKLGACRQEVRRTQDEPAPNAQKLCGTAYTEDQGNGTGKVVQDCRYNVMDNYCRIHPPTNGCAWMRSSPKAATQIRSGPHLIFPPYKRPAAGAKAMR